MNVVIGIFGLASGVLVLLSLREDIKREGRSFTALFIGVIAVFFVMASVKIICS